MGEHGPHVAYLVSEYPKLSHAFIASEIKGVRSAGVEVDSFAIRPPGPQDLRDATDRLERDRTTYLTDVARRKFWRLLWFGLRHAPALVGTVGHALRFCRGSGRFKSFFYSLEAVILAEMLLRRDIRHVHVHFANNSADIAYLAVGMCTRVSGRQHSWSLAVHGPDELTDTGGWNLARKVRAADFVAAISYYCRSQVLTLLAPAQWAKVHVVRMGVNPAKFPESNRAGRPDRPMRVLFVGRLVVAKAPQLLVEAIGMLPRGSVEVRIVGAGELNDVLVDKIAAASLAEHITLLGARSQDELPRLYEWADVFCLPSLAEGLPVVLMEAMATGLPVVTSNIAGVSELVVHEQTGLLTRPGDVSQLAAALESMTSAARRLALARGARARVTPDFDSRHAAEHLATQLRAALHGVGVNDVPSNFRATDPTSRASP